jgi:hypothetical protein
MASPFFTDDVKVVASPAPQAVVSDESGSTTKALEMRLGSAAAAGVRLGGLGGAEPALGLPQLKSPPEPVTLTAPAGQLGSGEATPEFAQSNVTPEGDVNRMFPSIANHEDGAAREGRRGSSAALAPTAMAMTTARRRGGRTVERSVPEFTHEFNSVIETALHQRTPSLTLPHEMGEEMLRTRSDELLRESGVGRRGS